MVDGPAIEIVLFRLKSGADEAAFLHASADAGTAIMTLDGFISRQLFRGADGQWIDIIAWRSVSDALAVARLFPTLAGAEAFSALIEPASITVHHGEAVADRSSSQGERRSGGR